MKKIIILLAISSLVACHKTANQPTMTFDMPYSSTEALQLGSTGSDYTTPMSDAGATLSFAPVRVATNSKQYFDKYHITSGNVVSTYLAGMNLQIPNAGNHYFDFADKLELYISGNSQPEVLVAYDYNIAKGLKSINLTLVPGVNLKNYIVNDSITVRLGTHAGFIPLSGAQLISTGAFLVTAYPL